MPSSDKVQKSDLTGAVDSFLKSKRRGRGTADGELEDFLSILEFIDRFKLLPHGLFPVQKFILKLYYNIPLDNVLPELEQDRIKIFDRHTLMPIKEVSEVDYLKYLHSEGRCNIGEQDGRDRRELILVLGRRSGKSNLSAIISAYEIYKLLRRGNPQAHYGMPSGSEIRILCVANDKEQASIVYSDMSNYVGQVDYFKSSIVHDTLQYQRFQTQNDRERFGEGKKGTITATFKSSIAKGLRGRGIICFILDELAFFIDDGKCVRDGTLVLTDRGIFPIERLGDPLGPEWQDCSVSVSQEGPLRRSISSKFLVNGRRPTKKVVTKSRYEICGTGNHRVKVLDESGSIVWKKLSDISIGDFIGIHRETDMWSSSYVPTLSFAEECAVPDFLRDAYSARKKFLRWMEGILVPIILGKKELCKEIEIRPRQLDRILSWLDDEGYIFRRNVRVSGYGGHFTEWLPFSIPDGVLPSCDKKEIEIPDFLDERWGLLLGILVGDGIWAKDDSIQVTGGCEEFKTYVESLFDGMFGGHQTTRKTRIPSTCPEFPWTVTFHSVSLRKFLHKVGYDFSAPHEKHIPWAIFESPKSVVSCFLSGLFETDGGTEYRGGTVSFSTASEKLATQVQILLLNFGVTANRYRKWNKKYRRYCFVVRIIGLESRIRFFEKIGFLTKRKNDLLNFGLSSGRDISNIVPHQYDRIRCVIDSVPSSSKKKKGTDRRSQLIRICASSSDPKLRGNITYSALNRFLEKGREFGADSGALDELESISRTNYFWDPVTEVEDGVHDVYDLCVPDGESFVANGMTNHNSSAKRVYDALSPSTMQFTPKNPNNMREAAGGTEGRKISISSPDAKEGFFYNLYQLSLTKDKASEKMLMIQAPTWEVRPDLSRDDFEIEYAKDPRTFDTEFGANFSDRVRGWITDAKDLTECINPDLRPYIMGRPRDPYWAGVDFGISKDGTAISLTHINNGKIELAYHETWYPRKRWKETNPHLMAPLVPYANTLHTVSRLDIDEIAKWLGVLSKRFYIIKGVFDQWAGPIFEQKLHKEGLPQFESKNFTSYESSQCYSATEMLLLSRTLSIYDYPIPEVADIGLALSPSVHSPHIMELLELQASSGGKNIVVVEAPNIPGKHDDFSDSFVRSCYLVSEYIKEHPDVLTVGAVQSLTRRALSPRNPIHARRLQMRMHGLPPKERRIPFFQRRIR